MSFYLEQGWLRPARIVPSPNFGPRPEGVAPDLLVIHNISLPPGEFGGDCIARLFSNCLDWGAHPYFETIRGLQVSSHLLIRRDGEVLQFVNLLERAWHAGQSSYQGRDNCNDFSIGIELEGSDDTPYEEAQYRALAAVSDCLLRELPGMSAERIAGHSDIAPGRKTDPGPAFDWSKYRGLLHCGKAQ
ncbi:1,6-anhydro-N-acetylmuramyl-L-alanine amidase AmpD [Parahaliea aestuarii]|uniref:1,6-anhydro-N-acetylmuramyl-L-alanine amidase AmpD n=1 Tax=Parahaliea aestuarii TaxID=1852021 RepID=A0A5C9A5F4_9GAMM|nr:1,6-anhydro-N-acetylmuramyl-L-alanine amidase AmpD [Parahaliea aestuarii]TXS94970.1 1,6-anhydro-N-acetylmuramyl-L-alanine amidase AmpD [Parahaliea aestuarii]